jgi:hypothetical protein
MKGQLHRVLRSCVATLVVLLLPTTQAAPQGTETEIPAVKLSRFYEKYNKNVDIGGRGLLVGATVGVEEQKYLLSPALLVPVNIYQGWSVLCIETVSIDGSYSSHGELARADLDSHHGLLRFTPNSERAHGPEGTEWPHEIREFDPGSLAVLASVGACGSDENHNTRTVALVNRSSTTASSPLRYRLYVNPRGATHVDVMYRRRDGQEMQTACVPAESKLHSTAFSLTCELQGPFDDITPITLMPFRYERALRAEPFSLIYGRGSG